jgi:hypothetical protein
MIMLRVFAHESPLSGFFAHTEPRYQFLGLWLDGDVRGGADDYDIEYLWREIGRQQRGEIAQVRQTSDVFTITVKGDTASLSPGVVMRGQPPMEIALADLADATERWFDVVDPHIAGSLRAIRAGWA